MIKKELACLEFKARCELLREELGLASFQRNPTVPANEGELPCIYLLEGSDVIYSYPARSGKSYPAKRLAEITVALIMPDFIGGVKTDIKTTYRAIRSGITKNIYPVSIDGVIDRTTYFREGRTDGPEGYGLPDILSMRLTLELFYIDEGN